MRTLWRYALELARPDLPTSSRGGTRAEVHAGSDEGADVYELSRVLCDGRAHVQFTDYLYQERRSKAESADRITHLLDGHRRVISWRND